MNYIYDILVNFDEKEIFEFYEWNKEDNIEHLRRIPIFKVNEKTFRDFKDNKVKVDKNFLIKIRNKTEMFSNKLIAYIEYASIFTDGSDLVVIEFDKNGNYVLKSSMLLDEAEDTLAESEILDIIQIEYEVFKNNNNNIFMTRKQKYILNYIQKELQYLLKNKNYDKLKYLYYEWYNKKCENIKDKLGDLFKILDFDFSSKHTKFFDLIKLSNMKKQL